jgi:hypothetical protein
MVFGYSTSVLQDASHNMRWHTLQPCASLIAPTLQGTLYLQLHLSFWQHIL